MAKRPTSTKPPASPSGVAAEAAPLAGGQTDGETGSEDADSTGSADAFEGDLDDRTELVEHLQRAIQQALDTMDDVARSTAFIVSNPADASLVDAARLGFDGVRQAMANAQAAIGAAVERVQYQNLERREFELVKDVELDGVRYGPSYELAHAPLTQGQHADLKAIHALYADWDEGAAQEGPERL